LNVLDPERRLQSSALVHRFAFVLSSTMTTVNRCRLTCPRQFNSDLWAESSSRRSEHGVLVQRKNDRSCDISRIERQLELVKIVLFLLQVAA